MCAGAPPTLLQFLPHFYEFHSLLDFWKQYAKGHVKLFLPTNEAASNKKYHMTNHRTMGAGGLAFENVFGVYKRLLNNTNDVLHQLKYV
jgi:hypothetical protein